MYGFLCIICSFNLCPRIVLGVMELVWGGLHSPWHVDWRRIQTPCISSPTAQLITAMASSYPPPFEGTGEVKEGFLCPLCLKDLQSFYQLQDHYEEEHSGDDRHVRGQLKSKSHVLVYSAIDVMTLQGWTWRGNWCQDDLAAYQGGTGDEIGKWWNVETLGLSLWLVCRFSHWLGLGVHKR